MAHLLFCRKDYARLGTRIKCNPAIKETSDRNALRLALNDGRITTVATDHAPHQLSEKQGGCRRAASGMPMVQFSLPAMMTLADEGRDDLNLALAPSAFNLDEVYDKRHDVRSLVLATKIYDQQVKVARSEMMPKLAAVAALHATNPNSYNGFENRFGAAFSIGATLQVPLWHWGGLSNKVKAAQVDAAVKRLELDDAKEKIALQISQAAFRYQEAFKTLEATKANLDQANENMRIADLAFKEGMGTIDEVLTAQTAWLKANSEKIDAEIDVQLTYEYLTKVMGTMNY